MTIRLLPGIRAAIGNEQIVALITESILTPTNDDAPSARSKRPHAGWVTWSRSRAFPGRLVD